MANGKPARSEVADGTLNARELAVVPSVLIGHEILRLVFPGILLAYALIVRRAPRERADAARLDRELFALRAQVLRAPAGLCGRGIVESVIVGEIVVRGDNEAAAAARGREGQRDQQCAIRHAF